MFDAIISKCTNASTAEPGAMADLHEGIDQPLNSFEGEFTFAKQTYPYANVYADGEIWLTDTAICIKLTPVYGDAYTFFKNAFSI